MADLSMKGFLAMRLGEDKTFKTAVMILLAGLTLVTSLIVILNARASSHGAAAGRDARILGIRYLTHLNRSLWDMAGEKDLVVDYQELSGLKQQARAYENLAQGGDALFYRLAEERLAKLQQSLAAQGEVTKPPYFNPQVGNPDFLQYYLDRVFIPAADILEHQERTKAEGAFWGSKSSSYTSGLAVMALAVFLLTLSLVLGGKVRFFMAGAGLGLVAAVIAIAAAATMKEWHGQTEESIRQFAHASGFAARSQMFLHLNGDSRATKYFADQAEAELDKILGREPDYLAAVQLRARVRSVKGEASFFEGLAEESRVELENAVADMERVIRSGRADGYLYWSRGYAEFLLGRRGSFERSFEKAMELLPDFRFALGAVRATGLMFAGKAKDAEAVLEEAVEYSLEKPLASDPIYYRTIIHSLERLNELRPGGGFPEMIKRLKEASVAIAVLKKARPGGVKSEVAPPQFVAPVYDQTGEIVDLPACSKFPKSSARVYFLLELKGMERGQSIVRKVYRHVAGQPFWIEQLWLGRVEHWEGPGEARLLGSVENVIPEAGTVLLGGEYRIEIYIDGNLKVTGFFEVL